MDIINIRKNDINIMVEHCLNLLMEDQAAKSISAAIKLLMDKLEMTHDDADYCIRTTIRGLSPILRSNKGGKFILGVTRLHLEGMESSRINALNAVLEVIVDNHFNEYDRNLNGLHLAQLLWGLKDEVNAKYEADRNNLDSVEYKTDKTYNIVKINSFEEAQNYSNYTSWCITKEESMYNSYTQRGINQFYFCLEDGFETIKDIPFPDAPRDRYGLSMLAVCVDENGNLLTCTCRWNHDQGGNDHVLDAREISELIGRNFYAVFKPNNSWNEMLALAMSKLNSGVDPFEIFDDIYGESNGLRVISFYDRNNYLTEDNKLLSKEWFEHATNFREGYGAVTTKYGCNLIDTNGNFVFDTWYDEISQMYDGVAKVRQGQKWNYLKPDGTILCDMWFDLIYYFEEGCAVVHLDDRGDNLIDMNGNFICDRWWAHIGYMNDGLRRITNDENRINYIDNKGHIVFQTWFIGASDFINGLAHITLDKKDEDGYLITVYINKKGEIQPNVYKITGKVK